jgi:hypothetical protein
LPHCTTYTYPPCILLPPLAHCPRLSLQVLQVSVGTASQQLKAAGLKEQAAQLQGAQESAAARVRPLHARFTPPPSLTS